MSQELQQTQHAKQLLESECCDLKKRVAMFETELKADHTAFEKKAQIDADERNRNLE